MDNIDRKYKLPPPLPTIQNGKPQPIYPLMLEHKGDNNQLFAGKYVGEIEHIYDLFYKLITCQSIDENNPLEHEAKIHNNNFYIYQNGKWVLIGDIRKPYFGAIDYIESTFDKQIDNLNYLKNEIKEIAKDGKNEINSVIDEARNINLQINDAARIVDEASLQAQINAKSVNIRQYKNIETMKQSTNVTDDLLIATQGFYVAGDGGNAQYYVIEDSEEEADGYSVIDVRERESGAKVGSAKVGNARTTKYKNRKIGLLTPNFVDVRWFGAKIDGITDDSDAFNRAVSFLVRKRKQLIIGISRNISAGTLYIPYGIMKINKPLEIDVGSVGIYFDGTVVDARDVIGDYAVRLYSSTWSDHCSTVMHDLYGLSLRGNNDEKTAIYYNNVPMFNLVRCSINDFKTGLTFEENCYIYNFYDVNIGGCDICVNNKLSANSGERLNFIGCTFGNSNLAIKNSNPNGSIHLLNCSIDYNYKAIEIEGNSSVYCTDCHFEWAKYENPHFVLNSGGDTLVIKGGFMVSRPEVDYGDNIPELNCMFDNINCGSTGGVVLDGVHISHIVSNYLFSGVNYSVINTKSYNPAELPSLCEQDIDYTDFENGLTSFIKPNNDCTAIALNGKNIEATRIKFTTEAQFYFYKKINPNSSPFGVVCLDFATTQITGNVMIAVYYGYQKEDGSLEKISKYVNSYSIKSEVDKAGANNRVNHRHPMYIDKNMLNFAKNYNRDVYICASLTMFGMGSETKYTIYKANFEQY